MYIYIYTHIYIYIYTSSESSSPGIPGVQHVINLLSTCGKAAPLECPGVARGPPGGAC